MPEYKYRGMLRNGKIVRGIMVAKNRHSLIKSLKDSRIQPIEVKVMREKLISESKYKTQVSFALDGMGQDPSVIRRWIKHGVNSLSTIIYIAEVLEIDFMELLK
jgi:hypothetical protein